MRFPFYIAILAVYPLLQLFAENSRDVAPSQLIAPMAIALAAALLGFMIIRIVQVVARRLFLRRPAAARQTANTESDMHAAAAITALAILAFYGYAAVQHAVAYAFGITLEHPVLPIVLATSTLLLSVLVLRHRDEVQRATRTINTFVLLLLALSAIRAAPALMTDTDVEQHTSGIEPWIATRQTDTRPDIYFIILDGYPSAHILREYYDFDNTHFVQALRHAGFAVNDSARANYSLTHLSLAASLNGILLNDRTRHLGDTDVTDIPHRLVRYNAVMRFAKQQGYRIYSVSSGWGPTSHSPLADVNIDCGQMSEYIDLVLRRTAAWPIIEARRSMYKARQCVLDSLGDLAVAAGPKFVFAHVLLPHPPYIFDRRGNAVGDEASLGAMWTWQDRTAFIEQLLYLNGRMAEIVRKFGDGAVIVLQGDHGTASTGRWNLPAAALMHERMSILSAVAAPGFDITADSIQTPVNTFHVLFAQLFGTVSERPEDASYFSIYEQPYRFTRVDSLLSPRH